MPKNDNIEYDIKEQSRLVLSIAIIATSVSLLSLNSPQSDMIKLASGLFIMPGLGSFMYLIMTGSYLKYSHKGEIGDFVVPRRFREAIFDWTINIFWIVFYLLVIFSIIKIMIDIKVPAPLNFYIGLLLSFLFGLALLIFGLMYYKKESQNKSRSSK